MKKQENLSKYSSAGLLGQIVIVMILAMFVIMYWISNIGDIVIILKWLVALLLLVMAFNNYVTFKRKYFTIFYLVAAVLSGVSAII